MIGIGVGIAACVAPLYIQELSPTRLRGRMVVLNVVMITGGQVIAYAIDSGFEKMHGGWRWMVGLGAVPAGLQFVFLFFLPESRKSQSPLRNHRDERNSEPFHSSYHDSERQLRGCTSHHGEDLCACHPRADRPQGLYSPHACRIRGLALIPSPGQDAVCCSEAKRRDHQVDHSAAALEAHPHEPCQPSSSQYVPTSASRFLLLTICANVCSCRMWSASLPATLRLQHAHVLQRFVRIFPIVRP